ncbi:hypothetical protein PILCRDRAFT_9500 [Piloderma croceum F 1598]|uniref:Uncharacterized protein n=1 Tax=Piloderma croceum (strain F 1598) TaxID=765440 RepID=A0A0C3F7T3_PILCF|nr:hypothetical protein PILCRDRAFT_9500 [Piloderma croceum F 1598]
MFQAAEGHNVDLPDVISFLPFVGLYTIVSLDPKEVEGMILATHHQPALSHVLTDEVAPENTLPTAPDVARIFNVQKLPKTRIPATLGIIPLSSSDPEFLESCYWRLPIMSGVVLAMLLERLPPTITCKEVRLARAIIGHLYMCSARNIQPPLGSGAGSSDGFGGGGDSGSGGPGAGEPRGGNSGSRRAHGGPNDHIEPSGSIGSRVTKRKREQSDQLESVQSEGSTSRNENNDDNANISYGYGGKQEDWEFGPDFSSNRIIFAASGQMLVGPACRPDLGPPES